MRHWLEYRYEEVKEIAARNSATISFVVRYALNEFLEKYEGKQLPLTFPT